VRKKERTTGDWHGRGEGPYRNHRKRSPKENLLGTKIEGRGRPGKKKAKGLRQAHPGVGVVRTTGEGEN